MYGWEVLLCEQNIQEPDGVMSLGNITVWTHHHIQRPFADANVMMWSLTVFIEIVFK